MLSRVVRPGTTTYTADYTRKTVQRERGKNLATAVTTGHAYGHTPKALYKTDFTETAERCTYTRPRSFKMELTQLPADYNSTAKPNLQKGTGETDYQHYFGRLGEMATVKQSVCKSRSLSKQTRAEVNGTTRNTHHPPGYNGHIPREWTGNRGKQTHQDRNLSDITWQFHNQKTGYSGYVPSCDMTVTTQNRSTNLSRTSTTYRDMCDELGYTVI